MTDPESGKSGLETPGNRRRFRSHMVNHDLRLRLVLDDVAFALIAALTAIGVLCYLSNREIGDTMYSAHVSIKQTRELLYNGAKMAGGVTFIAVLLFGFWSLIDAHRIAGPMHRLHRLLNEIAAGDLTHEIKFRKKDEFQEIASAVDQLVDVLEQRIGSLRDQALDMATVLAVDSLTPSQHGEIRAGMGRLVEELEFFKLPQNGAKPGIDNSPLT